PIHLPEPYKDRESIPRSAVAPFLAACSSVRSVHLWGGVLVDDLVGNRAVRWPGRRRGWRRLGHAVGYFPRRPIGLPSASASTQIRASGATLRGASRSVAPAASRVSRVASRSSTSAKATGPPPPPAGLRLTSK